MPKIMLGLILAIAAGVYDAAMATSDDVTNAAKYCNFEAFPRINETDNAFEVRLRNKCRVGDIILLYEATDVARLCDLSKPVVTVTIGKTGNICHLASKREVY